MKPWEIKIKSLRQHQEAFEAEAREERKKTRKNGNKFHGKAFAVKLPRKSPGTIPDLRPHQSMRVGKNRENGPP